MSQPQTAPQPEPYPEPSQAVTALVLGILGILGGLSVFLLGILGLLVAFLGPFGWYLGRKEMKAIDGGLRNPTNRGTAKAGMVLGIVGTVFTVLSIAFWAVIIFAVFLDA